MSGPDTHIRVLDSAYKPFPPFSEWASRSSIDTARWDRYKAGIEERTEQSREALKRAREVVKRAAAMDTGAIEGLYEVDRGFTFTIAFQTAAWELELAKKGENVRSLFEAQLHAYDFVLDLATKAEPITEAAVRKLHEVVCAAQTTYRVITAIGPQEQELVKGRYKVLPNHVRTRDGVDHSYAPVDVTPAEMQRLLEEMRSEAFLAAHPVMQAAYAHYGLVVIHPFADGNGRVARALASAFTYRAISMPIMILSEHKAAYLDALETADRGEYQSFVDFLLARVFDTMMLVNEANLAGRAPTVKESVTAIDRLFRTRGGYDQQEIDRAGSELLNSIRTEFAKIIATEGGSNWKGEATSNSLDARFGKRPSPDPAHRWPASIGPKGDWTTLHVELSTMPPGSARLYRDYSYWVPMDAAGDDDVQVVRIALNTGEGGSHQAKSIRATPCFSVRIEELVPSPAGVFLLRASLFAERELGEMLGELKLLAEKALRGQS